MSKQVEKIIAVVTTMRDQVGGGAPIFFCETEEEQQQVAFTLERCLDASVHQITPTTLIVVKH